VQVSFCDNTFLFWNQGNLMKTNLLLAATALIALTTGSAMAASPMAAFHGRGADPVVRHSPGKRVLYNQNSDSSFAYINSQNYTSGVTADNDQSADDFIVPSRKKWKVTEVDVTGCCSGTTSITENVYFYKDNNQAWIVHQPLGHGKSQLCDQPRKGRRAEGRALLGFRRGQLQLRRRLRLGLGGEVHDR
jgi:hypothetical protein